MRFRLQNATEHEFGAMFEFVLYMEDVYLAAEGRAGTGTKPLSGVHLLEDSHLYKVRNPTKINYQLGRKVLNSEPCNHSLMNHKQIK